MYKVRWGECVEGEVEGREDSVALRHVRMGPGVGVGGGGWGIAMAG